jgi:hypothetical protein
MASNGLPNGAAEIYVSPRAPDDFAKRIRAAHHNGQATFTYLGAEFQIVLGHSGQPAAVVYLLGSPSSPLPRELPALFEELEVLQVILRIPIPEGLQVTAGWYSAPRPSHNRSVCCVDPDAVTSEKDSEIRVNGNTYHDAIRFYRWVMSGRLQPTKEF